MISAFSISFLGGLLSLLLHRSFYLKPFTIFTLLLAYSSVSEPIGLIGFEVNGYNTLFGKILIIVLIAIILYSKSDISKTQTLFLLSGSIALIQSHSLLAFVISFETVALISLILISDIREPSQAEGAVKMFIAGAVASGIIMFGVFIFTISGAELLGAVEVRSGLFGWGGVVLILLGVFYKLTIFPMHSWAVDTYSLIRSEYASILSGVVKSVVAIGTFGVFKSAILGHLELISPILITLSIITMTLGNFMALWQKNISKILAWSSIAQAGYMLVAFVSVKSRFADNGILYMAIAYIFMQSGAFLILGYLKESYNIKTLQDIKGLATYDRFSGLFFTIYLFSLAGTPLLSGFLGKATLFYSGVDASLWWLILIALLNSALSVGYYAWIVKHIYFDEAPIDRRGVVMSKSITVGQIVLVGGVFYFGIFADKILTI